MSRFVLYDFQSDLVDRVRERFRTGHQGVLMQSITGSGKTVMFCYVVEQAVAKGGRPVLLVHTRELLRQTAAKLKANGVDFGIVAAGYRNPSPLAKTQLCMVHTVANRALLFDPTLVIIDEAHLAMAPTYVKLCERWSSARRLLVTATPERSDLQGFTSLATAMECGPSYRDLVATGALVRPRHFSTPWVDVTKLRVVGHDYDDAELGKIYSQSKLVGDIVGQYKQWSAGRRFVCFAPSVLASKTFTEAFNREGIRCGHIDGETPGDERQAILESLASGELDGISNCAVLTEGWDCPAVSCVILARPTQSTSLYIQMGGRGARPADGKTDFHLHDHGRNVEAHGYLDEDRAWQLEGERKKAKKRSESFSTCEKCWAIFRPIEAVLGCCPACGKPLPKKEIAKLDHDTSGVLVPVDGLEAPVAKKKRVKKIEDWKLWRDLDEQRIAKGYALGWTFAAYWREIDNRESVKGDPWLQR